MKLALTLPGDSVPENMVNSFKEEPPRSGMFNWLRVFDKGECLPWERLKERIDEFDAIQVNMSPMDMPIIPEIRRKLGEDSETKLIINNDYVCEYWGKWGLDPYYYDQIQRYGDMVFGTEPHQVSNMIKGAHCIPHPTNTKLLKRLGHDRSKDRNCVGFVFHWWAGNTYLPSRTLRHVKEKYGLSNKMFGYMGSKDEMARFNGYMFDSKMQLDSFPNYAEQVMRMKCLYDPNPCHTYGRNGVEAACWGIPVVGSNRVFSYNKLFPEMTCDPFDFNKTMEIFDKVLNDESFNKQVLKKAYDQVEFFNYENSKKRWNKAFKESIERGGHKWYQKV